MVCFKKSFVLGLMVSMVVWSSLFIWNNNWESLETKTYNLEENLKKSVIWDLTNFENHHYENDGTPIIKHTIFVGLF